MKDGLFFENDELIFYQEGQPYHAGVIKVDNAIYYISSNGRAVKGPHIVHQSMANDILKRGTYTFGDDYKLVKGSYIAPKKSKKRKGRHKHKTSRNTKFSKKTLLKNTATLVLALSIITLLIWIGNTRISAPSDGTAESISAGTKITLPEFEEDVLLCSTVAKSEFDGQLPLKDAVQAGNPYRSFQFDYHLLNTSGILVLSEDPSLEDVQKFELTEQDNFLFIDNLKTDTAYYYKAIVDGQEYSGSFRTARSNRFVSIPNLVNTRDIGGYVNLEGKTVNQGLLIRGSELDGLVNPSYFIPNEELEAVRDSFGFVYDMDLRGAHIYNGDYSSRLGIPHKFYDAPCYGEIFSSLFHNSLRQIFSDLADPQKYPMYLHCTWGTDRTGTIVFLLQGILNLPTEDMVREYELTGYTNPSVVDNGHMDVIINGLQAYEGDTLQEKIVTFLTTVVGVSEREIESIRNIFLAE